jgi:tripartite-type tricarboxylate transporter receptor subunit TctC
LVRTIAQPLEKIIDQRVIVEAKPGAGGNIGAEHVAKRVGADGYTLLYAGTSLASNVSLMDLRFDPRKDLIPVAGINVIPAVLIVGVNSKYNSFSDAIAAAKAKPGMLTFGSSGPGTASHLAGELFKYAAKVDMVHVPYKGSGAVLADLTAGRVDMLFEVAATVVDRVRGGQVRALATTAPKRSPFMPNVPTIAESGYPGFEMGTWAGLFAPAGTPDPVLKKLEDAIGKAINTEGVQKRFAEMSASPMPNSMSDFKKYFDEDVERWAKLVREGHVKKLQ